MHFNIPTKQETKPHSCYNEATKPTTEPLCTQHWLLWQCCLMKCLNVCLFRVWSLGETRLQLSVRNSRDEQQPPPPRYPSIRDLEKEVTTVWVWCVCCVCCVWQRQWWRLLLATRHKRKLHHAHFTVRTLCVAHFRQTLKHFLVLKQSVARCATYEYQQFPLSAVICVGARHTVYTL